MRAWPVARSILDAPLGLRNRSYVREANERTTSWISQELPLSLTRVLISLPSLYPEF